MVKGKKILGIILVSMLGLVSMITSFAASNQDVLLALQEGITLNTGEKFYLNVADMQITKNYLTEKGLSSSDLDTVLADIKTIQRTASTVSSLEEIIKNTDAASAINDAASVSGIKFSLDSGNVVITDSNGKSLLTINKEDLSKDKPDYSVINGDSSGAGNGDNSTGTDAIKQTGSELDLTNMTIVISAAVIILAGIGFAVYKFNLLRD